MISFELCKQRRFNPGQMYVAMSRVKSLDGLFVTGNITKEAIYPDKLAITEYARLREEANIFAKPKIERFDRTDLNLVFAHLNVRSFGKHSVDIEHDFILTNCDLLLLSETQIHPDSDVSHLMLHGFNGNFYNSDDKYSKVSK